MRPIRLILPSDPASAGSGKVRQRRPNEAFLPRKRSQFGTSVVQFLPITCLRGSPRTTRREDLPIGVYDHEVQLTFEIVRTATGLNSTATGSRAG